jgi:excisionase family DNA binding protein
MAGETLDLRSAAEQLGVHYQTAYKWVRSGVLASTLVRGRYHVSPEAVVALARRRDSPSRPRARRPRGGYEQARERMFIHLISGEERKARDLISGLVDSGVTVTNATQEVLVPALRRIGQEWDAGRLSISAEHRAAAIVERILGEHHPAPRGRRRGTAVVAAVAGDRHGLPTLMAAVALREDNWRVHHLGADVPPGELVDFCRGQSTDLAVITVTSNSVSRRARHTAASLEDIGVRSIVGRPGASLAELVGDARVRSPRRSPVS